ncbi:MAG: uroporphyrinogen-III C-methyltransferase [Steroidobacteraceae bacterium]
MNDDPSTALFADDDPRPGRPGLIASVLAGAALVIALFVAFSGRSLDTQVAELTAQTASLAAAQARLGTELTALAEREAAANDATSKQMESLLSLSRDVAALENTTSELQDRMTLPQRSWARAEALALLALAQRQLKIDRNVDAALDAMTTADSRLAQLREPALSTVRKQVTADLESLRSFERPDLDRITAQLRQAEIDAAALTTAGIAAETAMETSVAGSDSPGPIARAWLLVKQALGSLVTVRSTTAGSSALLTRDQQTLQRQQLQVLLLEARLAIARADQKAFASAIGEARSWLDDHFARTDATVATLASELTQLAATDIAPPLPDVSGSLRLLEQMVPITRAGP